MQQDNPVVIVDHALLSSNPNAKDELQANLPTSNRIILLGNAGNQLNQLATDHDSEWLTMPVRRSTLLDLIKGKLKHVSTEREQGSKIVEDSTDHPKSDTPTLKVLLAEDNPINAMLAKTMLLKLGHDVQHVENGAEAVHRLMAPKARFDVVLMDMHMPVMDGISAIRSVRQTERRNGTLPVRIIVLSADGQVQSRSAAMDAGADGFLTKPLDLGLVEQILYGDAIERSDVRVA